MKKQLILAIATLSVAGAVYAAPLQSSAKMEAPVKKASVTQLEQGVKQKSDLKKKVHATHVTKDAAKEVRKKSGT